MPVAAVAGDAQALDDQERGRKPAPGGTIFSRRYGPLPGWAWSLLIAGGVVAVYVWRQRSGSGAQDVPSPADSTGVDGATDPAGTLAALQSEIQALQGTASQDLGVDQADLAAETPKPKPAPGGGKKWAKANGRQSIWQLARANGITEKRLLRLNAGQANLKKYIGTGKSLPKGWTVRVG